MGKQDAKAAEAAVEDKGQGRAVILPNGQKRIDFIRDRYYNDNVSRSDIRKEVNAMYEEGADGIIPYQIVFAATKVKGQGDKTKDPRNAPKADAGKADTKDAKAK